MGAETMNATAEIVLLILSLSLVALGFGAVSFYGLERSWKSVGSEIVTCRYFIPTRWAAQHSSSGQQYRAFHKVADVLCADWLGLL